MQHYHKYVQWAYYNFPNTFNSYLTTHMSTSDKQKMADLFIYNLQNYQTILPHPSKRNHFGIKKCSCQPQKTTFLLNTSETRSNVVLFSIFIQTFLELIFASRIKTMLLNTPDVLLTSCQKIMLILCVWTLKYCTPIKEY